MYTYFDSRSTLSKQGEYLDEFEDDIPLSRYVKNRCNTRYLQRNSSIYDDEASYRQVQKLFCNECNVNNILIL